MTEEEFKDKVKELDRIRSFRSMEGEINRARSITVGTSFGGTSEILMRGDGGSYLWCVMQPVEVIELIQQLAANVGCQALVKPKQDFSSWRVWNLTEEEYKQLNGHPPFVNDMAPFNQLGINGVNTNVISNMIENGANGTNGGLGGIDPSVALNANPALSPEESFIFKNLDIEQQIKYIHELNQERNKQELKNPLSNQAERRKNDKTVATKKVK